MGEPDEHVERRLAAIFAADVAGYSRLMGHDEAGTLRALTRHRQAIESLVARYHGRIANTAGDSVLAEFASVVDAVRCAVAVQESLAEPNERLAEDHRLLFRIGVHVGDVMIQGGDLFGDGVNIAARLQAIAEPGGICLSGAAYDYVRKTLPFKYVDLGPQTVKNIEEFVHAYAIVMSRGGPASPATELDRQTSLFAAQRPSIAVLPFTNMSGDPEQEYFADGVVEDIITALTHVPRLLVIARNSSFVYKGRAVNVKHVGQELGVRYVLEGSIRKAGSKVRLTGQLIEATTGAHLWADRFDGDLSDIFALQDEITERVVGAMEPSLLRAEVEIASRKRPTSLSAYDLYLRALPRLHAMTREGLEEALRLLDSALKLEPHYSAAASLAAVTRLHRCAQGWSDDPSHEIGEALRLAELALAVDPNNPEALCSAARAKSYSGEDHEGAFALVQRATELCPNSASAWSHRGSTCVYIARPAEAVSSYERAIRLSPMDLMLYATLTGLSVALIQLERYEEALDAARQSAHQNPYFSSTFRCLAAALAHLGRAEEAKEAAQHLLRLDPSFTISAFDARSRWKNPAKGNYIAGMRLAGLPE